MPVEVINQNTQSVRGRGAREREVRKSTRVCAALATFSRKPAKAGEGGGGVKKAERKIPHIIIVICIFSRLAIKMCVCKGKYAENVCRN